MQIFNSPYDPNDPLNGQECAILSTKGTIHGLMLVVKFNDGTVEEVWAEEVQEA